MPLSISFTLRTSSFSTGVHLWIDSMGRKKRESPIKEPQLPPFFSLSQVLTEFCSCLLHQNWKPSGLWQEQDAIGKSGKGQLQPPGSDASKAYQHGQYRLARDASTGALPFFTLASIVCQPPSVGPILFVRSLFCFLHKSAEDKPSSSTVSTVCLQKQTVIITKY